MNKYQYCYNNPLRYTDSTGHEPNDNDPQKKQQQQPAQKVKIETKVEKQRDYTLKDPIKYPDGTEVTYPNGSSVRGIGVGSPATHKVTVDGKPAKPDSGLTIREEVKVESATPAGAEAMRKVVTEEDVALNNKGERGDFYGVIGPTVDPKILPEFKVVELQTLTVKGPGGAVLATSQNRITKTNTSVTVEKVQSQTQKPKQD